MRTRPEKLIVIGLDGLSPEILRRFTESGDCPRLAGLLREGSFAPLLPVPPVDGAANWSTIATGTWTGTHGDNSFVPHSPGQPFGSDGMATSGVFPTLADQGDAVRAQEGDLEWIWQAVHRAGRRCILADFPRGWPAADDSIVTVRGSGPFSSPRVRLAGPHLFATRESACEDFTNVLRTTTPSGWSDPPDSSRTPLEVAFIVTGEADLQPTPAGWMVAAGAGEAPQVDPSLMYCCLVVASEASEGSGEAPFDTLVVCRGRNARAPVAQLTVGEWSDWIFEDLKTSVGEVRGKFKLHLQALSPGGREIVLYRTPVFSASGWANPQEVAEELIEAATDDPAPAAIGEGSGAPEPPPAWPTGALAEQARGIVWTCRQLCSTHDWDVLMTHLQAPDALLHEMINELHPASPHYAAEREQQAWGRLRQEMMMLDRFVGELIDGCATGSTAVAVVSDHGMIPTRKYVWLAKWLIDAGLMTYVADEDSGKMRLHWPDTKAVLGDCPVAQNVWVNLKGRDPDGIVEPEEYETVRSEIINVLLSVRDPHTGVCPVAVALRREDARFLGQWGERVGDVVYFLTPGYTNDVRVHSAGQVDASLVSPDGVWEGDAPLQGAHHAYLPGASLGEFSVDGVLLLAGPGVRRAFERAASLWGPDVTPTLCHLMGIEPPVSAEGTVAADLLEADEEQQPG